MNWSGILEFLKLPFIADFFNWLFSSISKKKTNSLTESNVLKHTIFNRLMGWADGDVMSLRFSTDYRTIIFRKYLLLYLECHHNKIKSFIDDKGFQTMDGPQLLSAISDLITEINREHEKRMIDFGIPYVVIERMKKYTTINLSMAHGHLRNIFENDFYSSANNFLRMYTALNIITLLIQVVLNNSEIIFNSMGDELSGRTIVFLGKEYKEP